jgi:uncharacterized membrane protein
MSAPTMTRRMVRASALVFLLSAVTLAALPAAAQATTYRSTTPQSERTAVREVKWTSNVTVSYAKSSWTFTSDGLPANNFVATDYAVPANPFDVSASGASVIASAMVLKDQNYDYTLPLVPKYSKSVTEANQGPIGFLLDGGALYNPYEANHATVATSDNFVASQNGVAASFLDDCDGHPGPGGQYHYHGLPACLVSYATGGTASVASVTSTAGATTAGVTEDNAASRRPVILGFAFDGFGIYDNVAMNGTTVLVSALDSCNGIFSPVPGYPHGVYHYVLENVKGARSSLGCYHGVVSSAYTRALEDELDGVHAAWTPQFSSTRGALPASKNEDDFLLTMLRLRGLDREC